MADYMYRLSRLLERLSSESELWWSVREMADYCHLSENQFRRRFREKAGMGPKHYYDSLKMQQAAGKLMRQGDTLEKIARELGYRDGYHLSKGIQRDTGNIPRRVPGEIPYLIRFPGLS